jgi:cytochrome P450
MAMMEAVLLLAAIAERFHFSLVPKRPVTLFPSITLRPKADVWVRLSER